MLKFSHLAGRLLAFALTAGAVGVMSPPPALAADAGDVWYSALPISDKNCLATYTVTVKTADVRKAGTDSNISLEFTGYKGRTFNTGNINSRLPGNILERNFTNTLYICMNGQSIGHVTSLTLRSDTRHSGSGWMPEYVSIKHPDGTQARFDYNLWVEEKNKAYSKRCSTCAPTNVNWNVFNVAIKTSTDGGAGTDSNISLSLIDGTGNATRVLLNQLDSRNIFENNQLNKFTIWSSAGAGPVTAVKLESDGRYAGADWHVSTVTVTDKDDAETVFEYQRWINSDTAAPDLIGRPRVDLVGRGSVAVKAEEFRFLSALGDDGYKDTVEFKQSSERSIAIGRESGTTVGVEATVGYSSGDAAGWAGSVTASYERTSGKSMEDLSVYSSERTVTREIDVAADTLRVTRCTWSTPYDVYDITGATAGLDPVGFITGAPKCAFSSLTFPGDSEMSELTVAALRQQYSSEEADRIIATLISRGVKVAGGGRFIVTKNAGIPGFNDETHENVSLEACQNLCTDRSWCKSLDYERAISKCFLQPVTKFEHGLRTDYPGNPYDHYHRHN